MLPTTGLLMGDPHMNEERDSYGHRDSNYYTKKNNKDTYIHFFEVLADVPFSYPNTLILIVSYSSSNERYLALKSFRVSYFRTRAFASRTRSAFFSESVATSAFIFK